MHAHDNAVAHVLPDNANFAKARVMQSCLVQFHNGMGIMMGSVNDTTLTLRKETFHTWFTFEVLPPCTPIFRVALCGNISTHSLLSEFSNLAESRHVRTKLKFIAVQKNSARTYQL